MRLGFLGTRIINEAVVTGLLASDVDVISIGITKRSRTILVRCLCRCKRGDGAVFWVSRCRLGLDAIQWE